MEWSEVHIRKHASVAEGTVDDNTILVAWMTKPTEAEVDAVLNPTGAVIWKMLDLADTIPRLVSELCSQYDVSERQASRETIALVSSLASRGLLILQDEYGNPVESPAAPSGESATP